MTLHCKLMFSKLLEIDEVAFLLVLENRSRFLFDLLTDDAI